jgi:hypothetical protein
MEHKVFHLKSMVSKKLQVKFGFSLHLTLTANKDITLDYVATNILHMNTKNGKVNINYHSIIIQCTMETLQMKCPLKMNNNPPCGFRVFFCLPYARLLQVLTDQFLHFKRTSSPTSKFLQNFEKTSNSGSKICFKNLIEPSIWFYIYFFIFQGPWFWDCEK